MIENPSYHAHVYFTEEQFDIANQLIDKIRHLYNFDIGRVWDRPVGPHPIGSCQITIFEKDLSTFVPWLMRERGELSIFIHKNTGDDLLDHTQLVMWLGKSYKLNIDMFKKG